MRFTDEVRQIQKIEARIAVISKSPAARLVFVQIEALPLLLDLLKLFRSTLEKLGHE